ncbi:internalin [Bacillus toyonensis]|nr:internalin [Bacillus toyonensis]PGB42047.1 internalin [Bacillus toyonensis]PGE40776.1 internalin [Bacillus toyonensis]PHC96359.1 internalin [Bacillus toyonensis]
MQVKDLFLNTNEIIDYRTLKYMPHFKCLTVANAKIKDLSFFTKLKQMRKIRYSFIRRITYFLL